MEGRVHAQSSLRSAGSIGRVRGIGVICSGSLLEGVEIGNINTAHSRRLRGLNGILDEGGRVRRRR